MHEWLLTVECNAPGTNWEEVFPEGDAVAFYSFVHKVWVLDEEGYEEDITLDGNIVTLRADVLQYLEFAIDWVMCNLIPVKMELKRLD